MIDWTAAGAVTAIAALVLMFGVFMFALGASDPDRNEGVAGYILGAIGVLAWVPLAVVAGRMLVRADAGRRGTLGFLPALVTVALCGLAATLLVSGSTEFLAPFGDAWPASLGFLWSIVVVSFTSAGTIPVAFALLITNLVLRIVRRRHGAGPRPSPERA